GRTIGFSYCASDALIIGIEHGYHRFISLVGKNRNMTTESVDKIAQGRVWTGQDAMKHGLVDQIGDFDDAIQSAATLAHLESYRLTWVDKPLSPTQQILEDFFRTINTSLGNPLDKWIPDALKPAAAQISESTNLLNSFNDPKGYYAFCLNCEAI
ncbi:MAG: S49 family peptidase, partial [Vibrio casei]